MPGTGRRGTPSGVRVSRDRYMRGAAHDAAPTSRITQIYEADIQQRAFSATTTFSGGGGGGRISGG
ncbi:hypothetical protein ETAR_03220 [Edwardsiella tarda]|nr:hypothetical protein GBS0709_03270 [Edwardsiella tarda]